MTSKTDEQAAKIVRLTAELHSTIEDSSVTALKKARHKFKLLYLHLDLIDIRSPFYNKIIKLISRAISSRKIP